MSEPTPEPASQPHWPTYAVLTFSLAALAAAGAILSFALMHTGNPHAIVYAICCTVVAVVVFSATIVCLKLDQILKRQVAITQILGTVRVVERAVERIEEVVAGVKSTGLASLQRTGELRMYADALDVRVGNVDARLEELTTSLMAHRERTAVVVAEIQDEYRRTLTAAVDAIQRDVIGVMTERMAQAISAVKAELRREITATFDPEAVRSAVRGVVTREFDVFLLDLAEQRPEVVDLETVKILRQVQRRSE